MENTSITLELLAVDFRNTNYILGSCAIEKAIQRQLNLNRFDVSEHVHFCFINRIMYTHNWYGELDFDLDVEKVKSLGDEELIRTLILTPKF